MLRFDATIWNGKYGGKDRKDLEFKGNDQHGLYAYLLYDKDKLVKYDKEEDDVLILISQILLAMVKRDKEHRCISKELGKKITDLNATVLAIKECDNKPKYHETKFLFRDLLWHNLQDLAPKLSDELLDIVFRNLGGRLKDFMYDSTVIDEPEDYFDEDVTDED